MRPYENESFLLRKTTRLAKAMLAFAFLATVSASAQSFRYLLPAGRATLVESNTTTSVYGIDVNQSRAGGYASAMWHNARVRVDTNWSTAIRFIITDTAGGADPNGLAGGDGLAFVIQNWAPLTIGGRGFGIGYDGIRNGIAFEIDTWDDTGLDGDQDGVRDTAWIDGEDGSNHLAIHSNGRRALSAIPRQSSTYRSVSDIPDVSDGRWHELSIRYRIVDGEGLLECFVDDCAAPRLSMRIRLDTLLSLTNGTAYVGITGGTQMAYQRATIGEWCFNGECGCEPCKTDTLTIRDTVRLTDTLRVIERDTLFLRDSIHHRDTITKEITRIDTVTVELKVHDTVIVHRLETVFVKDTLIIRHIDTTVIRDTTYRDTCIGYMPLDTVCGYVTRAYRWQPGVGLFIRPNPVSDLLRCEVTAPGPWSLVVVDMRGVSRYSVEGDQSADVAVDVSELAPGWYFVKLASGDESRVISFLVRR